MTASRNPLDVLVDDLTVMTANAADEVARAQGSLTRAESALDAAEARHAAMLAALDRAVSAREQARNPTREAPDESPVVAVGNEPHIVAPLGVRPEHLRDLALGKRGRSAHD